MADQVRTEGPTVARAFDSDDEELAYLTDVKKEMDAAESKQEIAKIWERHYLRIGHKKIGRLLLGEAPAEAKRLMRRGRE